MRSVALHVNSSLSKSTLIVAVRVDLDKTQQKVGMVYCIILLSAVGCSTEQ